MIEKARFTHCPLGKFLEKKTNIIADKGGNTNGC